MSRKRPGWRSAERTYQHLTRDLQRKARDELVRNCLSVMEQARAALPDAWLAVKCDTPKEVIEQLDRAIDMAKAHLNHRRK